MTSSPALPYIEGAVIAICVWQIAKGFRTGTMHFGAGSIGIDCDRITDPRGFWMYGAFNAMTVAACLWLLAFPR